MKNYNLELKILLSKIRTNNLLPRPIRDHMGEVVEGQENDFYTVEIENARYSVECKVFSHGANSETHVYGIIKLPKSK